jgi:hypothetical protein
MTRAHRITKELESWWREYGGKPASPAWASWCADYAILSGTKLAEMTEEHSNAGRFGMSSAGGCTRKVALRFMGADTAELPGSTRATFTIGHLLEVMALASIRACGYQVGDFQAKTRIEPWAESTVDAIMTLDGVRTVVGIKSGGYKMSGRTKDGWKRYGFAQFPLDGVKKTNPGYWAQSQAEMHGLGLTQSLFVIVAKDMIKAMENDPILKESGSLSFYAELIPYDREWCEENLVPAWVGAWADVTERIIPEPMYLTADGSYVLLSVGDADAGNKKRTGTYDPCSYCDLREACVGVTKFADSICGKQDATTIANDLKKLAASLEVTA